jgi:hypothetical protein
MLLSQLGGLNIGSIHVLGRHVRRQRIQSVDEATHSNIFHLRATADNAVCVMINCVYWWIKLYELSANVLRIMWTDKQWQCTSL